MPCDVQQPVLGLVFDSLKMGGLERIVAHLAAMLRDMGFRVVLLSTLPPEEDFYPSPEGCTRVCVGGWETPEDAVRRQAAIKVLSKSMASACFSCIRISERIFRRSWLSHARQG